MLNRDWSMFDRCYSGFIKASLLKKDIRFLTLTSSVVSTDGLSDIEKLDMLRRNFDVLKKRYEKDFGHSFGDYFRVATLEGNGVIHILYDGSFIPRNWIVDNWNEIHASGIIDIRYPRGSSYDGAMYVISQYVAGQDGKKIFGYSRNWVYGGFSKDLCDLKKCCRSDNLIRSKLGFFYYPVNYGLYYDEVDRVINWHFNPKWKYYDRLRKEFSLEVYCENMELFEWKN